MSVPHKKAAMTTCKDTLVFLTMFIAGVSFLAPCPTVAQSGNEPVPEMIDLADQLPPDASERPRAPTIQIPESLNEEPPESQLNDWVKWIVLKNIPLTHEDNRKWGLQKQVMTGSVFDERTGRLKRIENTRR